VQFFRLTFKYARLMRIVMKKRLLALSLGLALSSISGAFAAIPQHLRIGTDPTYAPFESKNAQGETR